MSKWIRLGTTSINIDAIESFGWAPGGRKAIINLRSGRTITASTDEENTIGLLLDRLGELVQEVNPVHDAGEPGNSYSGPDFVLGHSEPNHWSFNGTIYQ